MKVVSELIQITVCFLLVIQYILSEFYFRKCTDPSRTRQKYKGSGEKEMRMGYLQGCRPAFPQDLMVQVGDGTNENIKSI